MSKLRPLDQAELAILCQLWQARYGTGRTRDGLTRDDLEHLLLGADSHGGPIRSRATLSRRLTDLKARPNLVTTASVRPSSKKSISGSLGGRDRDMFFLSDDAVSWPSSARILWEVWRASDGGLSQSALARRVSAIGLKQSSDEEILGEEEVNREVEFLVDRGYLKRHGNILVAAPRTIIEFDYVRAIAEKAIASDTSQGLPLPD